MLILNDHYQASSYLFFPVYEALDATLFLTDNQRTHIQGGMRLGETHYCVWNMSQETIDRHDMR